MNRSDKLSLSNMLRYNRVRSTYVNIPVNNRVETRYRYEDPPDINAFNSLFPNPADVVTTTYETVYQNQVITEKQTGKIPNPDKGKFLFYFKDNDGIVRKIEILNDKVYTNTNGLSLLLLDKSNIGTSWTIDDRNEIPSSWDYWYYDKNGHFYFAFMPNRLPNRTNYMPFYLGSWGNVENGLYWLAGGGGYRADNAFGGIQLKFGTGTYHTTAEGYANNCYDGEYGEYVLYPSTVWYLGNAFLDKECTRLAVVEDISFEKDWNSVYYQGYVYITQPDTINGTIEIQKNIQVPVQVPHEHRHHYVYRLENNGSYNYVVLYDYYLLDGVLQSTQTQVVKEYKTQIPYQVTVAGSASPIMYEDYVYKHIYYTVRVRRERCVEDDGGGIGACHGYHWEYWYENVVVDRMDPQYIPGIIVPNNFKWVDIARYLYDNNKLVRGQYNVGGYSSYANIYNNTPYYATDVSENRRSTYHNGVRSLWNRSSSILFEKSYQVSDPPYPQPNLTFIGNLTNNKTHFNSLSAAKYA